MTKFHALNEAAEQAMRKRRLRQLNSVLEVVLGDLAELEGVRATRLRLLAYARQLREFHT